MTIVGSSQFKKYDDGVERVHKRELSAVSAEYAQDEIVYVPGYMAQYGLKVIYCVLGGVSCIALWVAVLYSLLTEEFSTGLMLLLPSALLAFVATPFILMLPIKWHRDYHRALQIVQEPDTEFYDKIQKALE